MTAQPIIVQADALRLPLPDASVDAVVCDPPYGLEFMGKDWDTFGRDVGPGYSEKPRFTRGRVGGYKNRMTPNYYQAGRPYQAWCEQWATDALRVLRPGGWLLAFGGTRTWHRLACGIEDAGFEMRDTIAEFSPSYGPLVWGYGSGFPKGKGCLKPAWEPIIVARRSGSSVLQIDAARIGHASPDDLAASQAKNPGRSDLVTSDVYGAGRPQQSVNTAGRWPPNVALIHSAGCQPTGTRKIRPNGSGIASPRSGGIGGGMFGDGEPDNIGGGYVDADGTETVTAWTCEENCPVALLDQQSGERSSATFRQSGYRNPRDNPVYGVPNTTRNAPDSYGDQGGASRFMYTAKAGPNERVTSLIPSCSCQTVKPSISLPRDTVGSRLDAAESSSTSWSGSEPTAPSPSVTSSITETETSSTTSSATSSSSPPPSTSESTAGASNAPTAGTSPVGSAGSSSASTLITGTSAQRDGPSTAAADPATSPRSSQRSEPGVCAECGAPYKLDSHPTVKPLALMRWLIRLVTPPGGIVLDPFAGSGTTGEAAMLEGFRSILIDKDPANLPSIRVRTHPYVRRTKVITNGQVGPEQGSLL